MAEMLLVNPRRRKRRKTSARRKTTSRRRRRRSHAVASAPRRRRRRRSHVRMSNPRRRHSRRSLTRSVRRRRRNPSLRGSFGSIKSSVMPTIKGGFVGALGGLGLDVLWKYGKNYLPASVAGSGMAQYAAKLLGAILVGFVGAKVMRGRGQALATGAATVVIHDALKAQINASFPTFQLGEYLSYAPTVGVMGRASMLDTGVPSSGMGQYLAGIPSYEAGFDYSGEYNADGMSGY